MGKSIGPVCVPVPSSRARVCAAAGVPVAGVLGPKFQPCTVRKPGPDSGTAGEYTKPQPVLRTYARACARASVRARARGGERVLRTDGQPVTAVITGES